MQVHLAEYSNCNRQLDDNTNVTPVNGTYKCTVMTHSVPSHQEEIHGLKPTQAHSFYWLGFFFALGWVEPHIHSFPSG